MRCNHKCRHQTTDKKNQELSTVPAVLEDIEVISEGAEERSDALCFVVNELTAHLLKQQEQGHKTRQVGNTLDTWLTDVRRITSVFDVSCK